MSAHESVLLGCSSDIWSAHALDTGRRALVSSPVSILMYVYIVKGEATQVSMIGTQALKTLLSFCLMCMRNQRCFIDFSQTV